MKITTILFGILLGVVLLICFTQLSNNNNCCSCGVTTGNIIKDMTCCAPCPNTEMFNKVKEYNGGRGFGCAYSYGEVCEQYKKDNNVTGECFK